MTQRVLITEPIADEGVAILREKGYEVDVMTDVSPTTLASIIGDYEALIVRSLTEVNLDLIEAATNLKIIGRAGVSVENIDIEAATERGIIVCNAPTSNIVSAAEHTMTLLLACARQVAAADESMKQGRWERSRFLGAELYAKTLAICGLGRVGCLVAERAQAFGMRVIGYDPYCAADRASSLGVTLYDSIDEILPLADFITVHLPKTSETIGMFGPEQFAKMKTGVILINAARGGIYDIKSLADFVAAGKIAAVGIDVWEHEPVHDSPLHEFPQATLTPHIGASTKEAQRRAAIQIAEYVAMGLEGSIVPTALNLAPVPPELMDIVAPYVPACQMMGSMLVQINGELATHLKVIAAGSLANRDLTILSAGSLDGMLSYRSNKRVTPVNAASLAQRHGISIETLSEADAHEYASKVTLEADGASISCTLAGPEQHPRIIELLGYRTEIDPTGHTLIFEYVDGPGRIGLIGTILGNAGISITTMQVSKKEDSPMALVYLNIEHEVPEAVLGELRETVKPQNLWYIKL